MALIMMKTLIVRFLHSLMVLFSFLFQLMNIRARRAHVNKVNKTIERLYYLHFP